MHRILGVLSLIFVACAWVPPAPPQTDNPGTGTVAGRVMDAQNRPIAGIRVLLLRGTVRQGYDPAKTRVERSDAEGRYEFTDVAEGDYLVAAEPDVQGDPNGRTLRFYFPESMSGKEAYTLRVGPGSILTAIDIRCVPGKQGFEARGEVVDSAGQKPLTHMQLTYGRIDQSVRRDVETDANGSFVITRLDPGKYWVSITHERSEDYYCYPVYFEIVSDDVSGLRISAQKGISLKGKIVLNTGIPETLFGELNVVFHPRGISEAGGHPTNYLVDRYMEKSSPVSADGNFVIRGLPPLIGKLSLQRRAGVPLENYHVRIERGGTNLSEALRVQDKDVGGITIHVTAGTAGIHGSVKSVNSVMEPRRIRVLISLQNAAGAPFAKSMPLDDYGRFEFDGLLPGEYRVMAAVTTDDGLSRRSGDIYTVRVGEGETREIEILLGGK